MNPGNNDSFFFISDVHDVDGIIIGVIHVAAGSAGVLFITIVVVASILICVRRSKQKRMLLFQVTIKSLLYIVFKIGYKPSDIYDDIR